MWLLLLPLLVSANIETITFSNPGNYQLTPQDYHYSSQIIVEMWGAGGGGCSADCGIGGGSGAYIKATINTNLETFNLTVGLGGKGGDELSYSLNTYYAYPWCSGYTDMGLPMCGHNGTDTILTSYSNRLVAGGGKNGNFSGYTCSYYGSRMSMAPNRWNNGTKFITTIDGTIDISSNGYSGDVCHNRLSGCNNLCYNSDVLIVGGDGANSPYGGFGGIGNIYKYGYQPTANNYGTNRLSTNGSTPGEVVVAHIRVTLYVLIIKIVIMPI
jgi:hypothetical protein